jgi:hypothetical protein
VSGARRLAASTALAAAAGALTFGLWRAVGLPPVGLPTDAPHPGLWRWFFAGVPPLLFPAFTAVYAALARVAPPDAAPAVAAGWRWDRWSHVALLALPAGLLAWRTEPGWRLLLGALFVTILAAKSLLLAGTLYRAAFGRVAPEDDAHVLPGAAAFLGATALLLYAGLVPYVITGVSTTGDEPLYLMSAHSLLVDRDLALENNTRQGDAAGFYWARGRPWAEQYLGRTLPALLLPGYAAARVLLPQYPLAGRLGATLLMAVGAALAGSVGYRLCRDLGCARPASFWAWTTLALTPPLLVASGHVYPEVPALLGSLVGVRAVLGISRRPWVAGAIVLAVAPILVLLKERFISIAVGLLVWAAINLARRARWARVWTVAGLGLVGVLVLLAARAPELFPYLAEFRPRGLLRWQPSMGVALLGVVADQEFGLLFYAPAWVLAAAGVPALWRRHREAALGLLGLAGGYMVVLMHYRWMQWDAGWTPPPRFILAVVPLLLPFLAEGLARLRGRGLALVHTLWLAWSAGVAWCLALVPLWRYNTLSGRSTLLRLAGAELGLDLARFLPSLRAPTRWTWAILAAGGLMLAVTTLRAARPRTPPDPGWGVGAVLLRPAPALGAVAVAAALWVGAAAVTPTTSIEGEAMSHNAGSQYGAYSWDPILWVMTGDGELSERIVTWPGVTRITVVAGGFSTTGVRPRLELFLDDVRVADWPLDIVPLERWQPPRWGLWGWRQAHYETTVRTGFGRPTFRLRVSNTRNHRGSGQVQHAYVDRVMLQWAPGGAADRSGPGG